jgi:hypothetical protein
MTRLSVPVPFGTAGSGVAAGAGLGGAAGAGAPSPPSRGWAPAAGGRRRLRRLDCEARSDGLPTAAGGGATGAGSETTPLPAGRLRRLLRLRAADGWPVSAASGAFGREAAVGSGAGGAWRPAAGWASCRPAAGWRQTLAPTSPSAHSAPSAVWTSTRHTTIDDVAPAEGGRFWVKVQRA